MVTFRKINLHKIFAFLLLYFIFNVALLLPLCFASLRHPFIGSTIGASRTHAQCWIDTYTSHTLRVRTLCGCVACVHKLFIVRVCHVLRIAVSRSTSAFAYTNTTCAHFSTLVYNGLYSSAGDKILKIKNAISRDHQGSAHPSSLPATRHVRGEMHTENSVPSCVQNAVKCEAFDVRRK